MINKLIITILLYSSTITAKADNIITEAEFKTIYYQAVNKYDSRSKKSKSVILKEKNLTYVKAIAVKESNIGKTFLLDSEAKNPKSSAYGLFQFLNSTWKSVGVKKTSCPITQTYAFFKYLDNRYNGSAEKAYKHHKKKGWY